MTKTSPVSLPVALRDTSVRYGDNEAVVDGDTRLTYREYEAAVRDFARAAMALGIQRGDRAAVWAQNSWQWCVAALGLQAAGAALVPINTRFRGLEAAEIVRRSGAKALFTTTGFLGADYPSMLRSADRDLLGLPIVVMDGAAGSDLSWEAFLDKGREVTEAEGLARLAEVGSADIADIVFTSGSTGSPKGVIQPHGHVMTAMTAFVAARTLGSNDRSLVLAPMFAQFGLRGLATNVISGAATITQAVFNPAKLFELLEAERITDFAGPPTLFAALLTPEAARWDLSSLRVALLGSTAIPPELVRSLLKDGLFEQAFTAWGMTEACGPLSITPINADVERIAHYAGKPLAHVRLRVVKADGTVGVPGDVGELQAQSPTNMRGYLDEPELTSQTLLEGGWMRTGDIGTVDDEGYVKITDRLKDMIIVGGFNVASAEVEAMLRTSPGIADAAVVGRADERLGQVCVAFVVPEGGAQVEAEQVIAWCRETMANFKVPRHVEVLDDLPRNASLKVDKLALREVAASGH